MTTATVTGPLLTADSQPVAGRAVRAHLVAGPGGGHTDDGELIREASTVTDEAGDFSLELTLNAEIDPDGTYYKVTAAGAMWTVRLTSGETLHVGDPAIQVTPAAVVASGATTGYVTAAMAAEGIMRAAADSALDARVDAIEGLGSLASDAELTAEASARVAGDVAAIQRANHTGTQLASTISDFNTAVRINRLDQMATPTGPVAMGGQEITGAADPTAAQSVATRAYVLAQIAALVASSPAALDTLNELAAALGNDANFASTVTTALAGKQPLDSDLTAIAALTTTSYGRALLALADLASLQAVIGAASATAQGLMSARHKVDVDTLTLDLASADALASRTPAFIRQGVVFAAAQGQYATVYWPWIVKMAGRVGSPLDSYYLYYSTDHSAGAGGIAVATGPSPSGPWTNHGQVFVDTSSGTQTETPSVLWSETESLFFMYYQQTSVSGAVGSQSTCLATSPEGLTWTRVGKVLDIAFVTEQPSDGHTGYLSPFRIGARWVGYHLYGGGNNPRFNISHSHDGRTWTIDQRMLGYSSEQVANAGLGDRHTAWNHSQIVEWRGQLWWIGLVSDFSSGTSGKDARICMAPIAPSLRALAAPPKVILDGSGTGESVNFRALHCHSENGRLYLHYQCDTNILLAVA